MVTSMHQLRKIFDMLLGKLKIYVLMEYLLVVERISILMEYLMGVTMLCIQNRSYFLMYCNWIFPVRLTN